MSQKFTIKKLIIGTGEGALVHQVGYNGVTEIRDMGIEYESSIHFIYQIFVDGVQRYNVINCPVIIEYEDTV